MQKTALNVIAAVVLAIVLRSTGAARVGSGSRAFAHLINDTMTDLQGLCTDFAAELDLFLSTAGSADAMRSTSGLAGKCLWSPESLFEGLKVDGKGATYHYTGPVNPRAVTTATRCLPQCLPLCRLNVSSKILHWEGDIYRLTANVTYTDYAVVPDMYIYTAPHCWRVTRTKDMAFRIDAVATQGASSGFHEGTRLYTAMTRCLQSLGGWTFFGTTAEDRASITIAVSTA